MMATLAVTTSIDLASLSVICHLSYLKKIGLTSQSDEDVLTKEIETWRGIIEKLPTDEKRAILTKLLDDCYKYSVAMNSHAETNPFPSESLIMALLLTRHKLINQLKFVITSKNKQLID